jgi:hypothetical protein
MERTYEPSQTAADAARRRKRLKLRQQYRATDRSAIEVAAKATGFVYRALNNEAPAPGYCRQRVGLLALRGSLNY